MFQVQGSIVALVTPMATDGTLDFDALAQLIEFHIDNSTDAILAVGTTGESATLDHEEHCAVIRRVVELVKGRRPVIAGTGANSTREALDLTRSAMQAGADACLLVTPYYNKPTQEGLFQHFKLIAETLSIPQILYNVPGRTGCDMLPATVARLADLPNIVGIKEASGSVARVRELVGSCGERMSVFSGDDAIGAECILNGAKGVISVTANVAPQVMHDMCTKALSGDRSATESLNARLEALHKALFLESNPIPAKWAVARLGLIPPGIRLPLTPLSTPLHGDVEQAMRQADVLS